mgnify:CR=1 FL=1
MRHGPGSGGRAGFCTCSEGRFRIWPLAALLEDDVLFAHSWEGQPITRQHGGPVRLVLPKLYFWKSAKWIKRIEFSVLDKPGFWELRGYHNYGDPWLEQRYDEEA